jgi:hypothetical protein
MPESQDSQEGLVMTEPAFGQLDGSTTVHIIEDGETLCGGDLIDGHEKFKAKKWYKYDEPPEGLDLCRLCDAAFSDGTTMNSTELANAIRSELGVEPRDSGSLSKSTMITVLKELSGVSEDA